MHSIRKRFYSHPSNWRVSLKTEKKGISPTFHHFCQIWGGGRCSREIFSQEWDNFCWNSQLHKKKLRRIFKISLIIYATGFFYYYVTSLSQVDIVTEVAYLNISFVAKYAGRVLDLYRSISVYIVSSSILYLFYFVCGAFWT